MLHVTFAFESFLYQLMHRHALINLVFFEVAEPFWLQASPTLAAVRAVIIRHAQTWLPSGSPQTDGGGAISRLHRPRVHILKNHAPFWPLDANRDWTKLLNLERPALILTDYAWPRKVQQSGRFSLPDDYKANHFNTWALLLLHSLHLRRYDIVLMEQMEATGAACKGFFCQVPRPSILRSLETIVRASYSGLPPALTSAPTPAPTSAPSLITWIPLSSHLPAPYNTSLKAHVSLNALVAAVASLVNSVAQPDLQFIGDVWTLALVLSHHLPLHQRAFFLPSSGQWKSLANSSWRCSWRWPSGPSCAG